MIILKTGFSSTLVTSNCEDLEPFQGLIDVLRIKKDCPMATFEKGYLPCSHERPQSPDSYARVVAERGDIHQSRPLRKHF